MKTIGLLGGMSWESSLVYYREINRAMRQRLGGLHSAKVLMHSFDFAEVVALQKAGQWQEAGALLGQAAAGLEKAGADCALICTNTMHLVSAAVASHCSIPLIDIIDETAKGVLAKGCKKPLLLATRYTMEHGFYADQMARHGVEVLVPDAEARTIVHSAIFDELCQGIVSDKTRAALQKIVQDGVKAGADSVILGCTEICLILDQTHMNVPMLDSTSLHVQAALDFALQGRAAQALAA